MSADNSGMATRVGALLIGSLLGAGAIAIADEELPDIEFLEYLGSWEESDEDWLLFAAAEEENEDNGEEEKESKEAPEGEQVAELDDET